MYCVVPDPPTPLPTSAFTRLKDLSVEEGDDAGGRDGLMPRGGVPEEGVEVWWVRGGDRSPLTPLGVGVEALLLK